MVSCDDVRRLASAGRVRPAHNYHARDHHLSWARVLALLRFCFRVVPDQRTAQDGRLLHPNGCMAACRDFEFRVYRVDLILEDDDTGVDWMLIVTAMEAE